MYQYTTETISANPRVLGADPLVETGIGEEDSTLVLPYSKTARRRGSILDTSLKQQEPMNPNGIAISDVNMKSGGRRLEGTSLDGSR